MSRAGALDASRTTISGAELVKGASAWTLAGQATHMSSLLITTYDQYGNQRTPGGDALLASVTMLAQGGSTPTGEQAAGRRGAAARPGTPGDCGSKISNGFSSNAVKQPRNSKDRDFSPIAALLLATSCTAFKSMWEGIGPLLPSRPF